MSDDEEMPPPENVRPKNFSLGSILYNDGSFSIAFGTWNVGKSDEVTRLAMRWNGSDDKLGYPSFGKYPMWFQVPDALTGIIAAALRGLNGSSEVGIAKALEYVNGSGT